MFLPLLTTLALLAQPPLASSPRVVVPPLEAAGVPAHVVEFSQEHLYAELQRQGLEVVRADTLTGPAAKCPLAQPGCLQQLADAAGAQAVVVGELARFPSGFRVGTRLRAPSDGRVLAEHVAEGVSEEALLEALTQAAAVLAAPLLAAPVAPPPSAQVAPEPWPLRRWAWAPAVGGAALLGVGTHFLLQARGHHEALVGPRTGGAPLDGESEARAGRQAQTLSRVFYGLGGAGVLAGAAFFFFPGRPPGPEGQARVQLQVGPGSLGVAGVLP